MAATVVKQPAEFLLKEIVQSANLFCWDRLLQWQYDTPFRFLRRMGIAGMDRCLITGNPRLHIIQRHASVDIKHERINHVHVRLLARPGGINKRTWNPGWAVLIR